MVYKTSHYREFSSKGAKTRRKKTRFKTDKDSESAEMNNNNKMTNFSF